MSISPSGSFSASSVCSRSASQAPPVWSPIIALFGVRRGRSSAASCSQSFSASGSFMEILLEQELRGDRVHALALHAAQPALGLYRREALVHARHRDTEAAFERARKALDALHERMLAVGGDRQADHELRRTPLTDQFGNRVESRSSDRRQRMRRAELGFSYCHPNAL